MPQLALRVPPLALVVAFAVAIALVTVYLPLVRIPLPGHKYASAALIFAGLLVALVGVIQFRRARTTVNPMSPSKASAVVSSGIYRWSRNPMYLGMALALLGLAAWALRWPATCWYRASAGISRASKSFRRKRLSWPSSGKSLLSTWRGLGGGSEA